MNKFLHLKIPQIELYVLVLNNMDIQQLLVKPHVQIIITLPYKMVMVKLDGVVVMMN